MSKRNEIQPGVNFPPMVSVMLLPNWRVVVVTNRAINSTRAKKFVQEKLQDKLVFKGVECHKGVYLYFYYVEHNDVEQKELDEFLQKQKPI